MAERRPPQPRFQREFVTSEGIDLRLHLASAGERASAFLIDIVVMFLAMGAMTLLIILAFGASDKLGQQVLGSLWLLGFFVIRNGYFIAFELGMRAATPGKRVTGLRVVARDGGRLSGEAVVARNAVRELELYLPMMIVLSSIGSSGADLWMSLAAFAWAGVFLFLPLFNRDRLRVGDLIAGTWVVRAPRRQLAASVVTRDAEPAFIFTDAQLAAYGEFELKALEDVLRREDELAVMVVARTIRGRIGWTGAEDREQEFLQAYYAALCARLERNMLFGKRRSDKYQKP